jgi:hypothetical protein
MFLLPLPCPAQNTLEGSHCLELGSKKDLIAARNLVRTLAIRNAIEASGVLEQIPAGLKTGKKERIIQRLRSGHLKDIKVLEHKETGALICETIEARADTAKMKEAVRQLIQGGLYRLEEHGIANNGCLKVLAVNEAEDRYGRRVEAVTRVIRSTGPLHTPDHRARKHCYKICIDYLAAGGVPVEGDSRFIDASAEGLVKGEIRTVSFYPPPGIESYQIWLPGEKKSVKPATPKRRTSKSTGKKTAMQGSLPMAGKIRKLEDILTQNGPEGLQVELVADGPIENHRYFFMDDPARLVIDIPGRWRTPGFHSKQIAHRLVERIRIGRHSKKMRVVLDLKNEAALPSAVFNKSPHGLRVMIK